MGSWREFSKNCIISFYCFIKVSIIFEMYVWGKMCIKHIKNMLLKMTLNWHGVCSNWQKAGRSETHSTWTLTPLTLVIVLFFPVRKRLVIALN